MSIKHNEGWHTTEGKHEAFFAMYQGIHDAIVEVFPIRTEGHGTMMCTRSDQNGVVYITREQAKAFFDLKD